MSAWVLARDLPALAEAADTPELRALYELLRANYTYPVDSIVISPDLEVMGQMDVSSAYQSPYDGFLREALADGE